MRAALFYLVALGAILCLAFTRALTSEDPVAAVEGVTPSPRPSAPVPAPGGHVGVFVAGHATDVATTQMAVVVSVEVDVGDHVLAGAPLVRVDARAAEHELTAIALEEQQLRELSTRGAALLDAGVVSREEATQMRFAARAKAAHARRARVLLDAAVIRAPFAGTVVERRVEQGMVLDPGTPALRILSDGPALVRFGLAPALARGLALGDEVWFRDAADVGVPAMRAHIHSIADELDRSTDLVTIEAGVQGLLPLRSGSRVRVFTAPEMRDFSSPDLVLSRAAAPAPGHLAAKE